MTAARQTAPVSLEVPSDDPESWTGLKIWHGMRFAGWLRLLRTNRFAIDRGRLGLAATVTAASLVNSGLGLAQRVVFGRRLARVELDEPPVFVVGHPRTGTTFTHELLAKDPRHSYATTYECAAPSHFLLTERLMARFGSGLLPRTRLPDPMLQGLLRPQEDEIALCNLGQRSPYLDLAFPNQAPHDPEFLELERLPAATVRRWQDAYAGFLRSVTLQRPGRLVLKNPLNTCRLRLLASMFPGARFIYLVRDPQVVIPSTLRLWKLMHACHGLQTPHHRRLVANVFDTFDRMFRYVEAVRDELSSSQFVTLRYEQLARDPMTSMRRVYEQLSLGDFEVGRDALSGYLQEVSGYQPNRYDVPETLGNDIAMRCADFMDTYGYRVQPA